MKILLVSQCFYPENFRVNDLCRELVARGHEVTVLAGIPVNRTTGLFWDGYSENEKTEDEFEGAKVYRAYNTPRHHDGLHLIFHYFSFWFFGNNAARKLAKENDFDIVMVYQLSPVTMAFPAIKAARKKKIPLLIYTLDLWPESAINAGGISLKPVKLWLTHIVKKIYHSADYILISSRLFKERIMGRARKETPIEFFPQYAEDCYEKLTLDEDDPIYDELPKGYKVIFTGNIGTSQSLDIVVDAANRLKDKTDIYFVIVGDGRDMERVMNLAKKNGVEDKVIFTGRKPMSEMSRYLSASDAALLILREDPLFNITLPAKTQSYMACGIPIIGCIAGEGKEIIKDAKCGVCSEKVNGESLAKAVLELYSMSEEEKEMLRANAIKYSEDNFNKEKLLDRLEKIMGELV